MYKYSIEQQLKSFSTLKVATLTAQEDLQLYRVVKLLRKTYEELQEDKKALIEQSRVEGVLFLETGLPDEENSNKDALSKANEKLNLLINEEFDTKLLDISTLNKLKVENNFGLGYYEFLLEMYLKDDQ